MGSDIYRMEKALDTFRRLCEIYINNKPLFENIISGREWVGAEKPQDERIIFIEMGDCLEGDANMYVNIIVLGFRLKGTYYAFSPTGRIELPYYCGLKWQYVDDSEEVSNAPFRHYGETK